MGGVEVVNPMGQGVVHHLVHLLLVHGGIVGVSEDQGHTHGAEAQAREGKAVKFVGQHGSFLLKCHTNIIFDLGRDIKPFFALTPVVAGGPDAVGMKCIYNGVNAMKTFTVIQCLVIKNELNFRENLKCLRFY